MNKLEAYRAYFKDHPIDFSGLKIPSTLPLVHPASPAPVKPGGQKLARPLVVDLDLDSSLDLLGQVINEGDFVDIEAERRVVAALGAPTAGPELAPLDGAHHGDEGLDISRMYGNAVLFGHDPLAGIVAVEFVEPNIITVYKRDAAGVTGSEITRFSPFMWDQMNADSSLMLPRRFVTWYEMRCAYDRTRRQRVLWNPVQQYLTASGRTLFKGMRFEDIVRLQVDIETSCAAGYELSNPERDHIIAIALSDSTGWETLLLGEETTILKALSTIITERDPDVIEGHHIFNFDLPFMLARSLKLKVPLLWGRDGSHLYCERDRQGEMRKVKVNIASNPLDVRAFRIHGRHIIDTMILAALYDTATRRLPSLKLKAVAAALGIQAPGRIILHGDEIQRAFSDCPRDFAAYALGDVRETRAISSVLSPSYFIQAQMFPMNYQDVILTGTATRVNALLLREYLRADHPVPVPPPARKYRGALCEIHQRGVIREVSHCDVSSLYPTIMLLFECLPKSDTLGVLRAALSDQRNYRLRAKYLADSSGDESLKILYNVLQNAFKTLINSSYGYLGTSDMNFGDYAAAEMVTAIGRNLIGRIRDWLSTHGCAAIELDTDGIFFHRPPHIDLKTLSIELNASLPHGMSVDFDREYEAMVSYKRKNYALLDSAGRIIVKGSSLRSRGCEAFLSRYKAEVLRMLLIGKEDDIPALFEATVRALRNRELPLEDLAKTQTLKDALDEYLAKVADNRRCKDAAYEATIGSGRSVVRGDKVAYYATCPGDGEKKRGAVYTRAKLVPLEIPSGGHQLRDEDVELYVAKLEKTAKMFDDFAPHVLSAPPGSLKFS